MKKIIFVVAVILAIYYIDLNYNKQPDLVLSFGNMTANYNYRYNDTKIPDIINDISSNMEINYRKIQNILIKASTIYIDLNGLFKCDNFDSMLVNIADFEKLIKLIRKYSKEKIYVNLLKEDNDISNYANEKLMLKLKKYDIIFLR